MHNSQNVLIVIGMQRSGTSLLAKWLNNCGLHLGDKLIPPGVGNLEGFYEDLDFAEFHWNILHRNGISKANCIRADSKIEFINEDYEKAKNLINGNNRNLMWGWKHPDTCLFLDFWKEIIPNIKVIAIYRHFNETVHSAYKWRYEENHLIMWPLYQLDKLLERTFKDNLTNQLLESWIRHNQDILDFKIKYPKQTLLIGFKDLVEKDMEIFECINTFFDLDLQYKNIRQSRVVPSKQMQILLPKYFDNDLKMRAKSIFDILEKEKIDL